MHFPYIRKCLQIRITETEHYTLFPIKQVSRGDIHHFNLILKYVLSLVWMRSVFLSSFSLRYRSNLRANRNFMITRARWQNLILCIVQLARCAEVFVFTARPHRTTRRNFGSGNIIFT